MHGRESSLDRQRVRGPLSRAYLREGLVHLLHHPPPEGRGIQAEQVGGSSGHLGPCPPAVTRQTRLVPCLEALPHQPQHRDDGLGGFRGGRWGAVVATGGCTRRYHAGGRCCRRRRHDEAHLADDKRQPGVCAGLP